MANNLPQALNKAIDAMESASAAINIASGDFNYLKLAKSGEWIHGSDDLEVSDDSVFAVSVDSFFSGYQAWDDGELLGEEMQLLTQGGIMKDELPADVPQHFWKPMIGFQMICIEGADQGLQLLYKTTSKGGIKSVDTLMKTILAHVKEGNHDGKLTPVIQLDVDSYRHKKYGKIFTPELTVVEWIDEVPTAKGEVKADPAEAIADDVDDPKPQRRRRRNAA